MASKEKEKIVVDHVHSKRDSPEEQPSETKGGHVAAAIYCLTIYCYHSVHCCTYRSGVCKKTSYLNL